MKYVISIICLNILSNVGAQIQKGAILTGGNFSFNSSKSTEEFSAFSSSIVKSVQGKYGIELEREVNVI